MIILQAIDYIDNSINLIQPDHNNKKRLEQDTDDEEHKSNTIQSKVKRNILDEDDDDNSISLIHMKFEEDNDDIQELLDLLKPPVRKIWDDDEETQPQFTFVYPVLNPKQIFILNQQLEKENPSAINLQPTYINSPPQFTQWNHFIDTTNIMSSRQIKQDRKFITEIEAQYENFEQKQKENEMRYRNAMGYTQQEEEKELLNVNESQKDEQGFLDYITLFCNDMQNLLNLIFNTNNETEEDKEVIIRKTPNNK